MNILFKFIDCRIPDHFIEFPKVPELRQVIRFEYGVLVDTYGDSADILDFITSDIEYRVGKNRLAFVVIFLNKFR